MSVVPLTVIIGLCLVFSFVIFFLREHARGRLSSAERDSLLPLAEENSRLVRATVIRPPDSPETTLQRRADPAHHEGDRCGCRDGCPGSCAGRRR